MKCDSPQAVVTPEDKYCQADSTGCGGATSYCKTWQTPAVCQGACNAPCKFYTCDSGSGQCVYRGTGPPQAGDYTDPNCGYKCGGPAVKCYQCVSGQCVQIPGTFTQCDASKGQYSDPLCNNKCGLPPPQLCYKCNPDDPTKCIFAGHTAPCDASKGESTDPNCLGKCVVPPPTNCYTCDDHGNCSLRGAPPCASGEFIDAKCLYKPNQSCYSCDVTSGVCVKKGTPPCAITDTLDPNCNNQCSLPPPPKCVSGFDTTKNFCGADLAPYTWKPPLKAGRKYRLGLWHEGIPKNVGSNESLFKLYCKAMVDFVTDKQIDRIFFLLQDPTLGYTYCDIENNDWLVNYLFALLPQGVDLCVYLNISSVYPWKWKQQIKGGNKCSNIGYMKQSSTNCPTCDNTGACNSCKGTVDDPTIWSDTCPNNMEQATYLASLLQQKLAKLSTPRALTCIGVDLEGGGIYARDSTGYGQLRQAASCYLGPNITVGGAGNASHTADDPNVKSDESYPELYWFGELEETGCTGDGDFTKCGWNSRYYTTQSLPQPRIKPTPQDMLAIFRKYLDKVIPPSSQERNNPRVWPLLSIENLTNADASSGNMQCIANYFGGSGTTCGKFNGFSFWDWDNFEAFMDLLADPVQGYGFKNFCIYEWQFVPQKSDWLKNPLPPLTTSLSSLSSLSPLSNMSSNTSSEIIENFDSNNNSNNIMSRIYNYIDNNSISMIVLFIAIAITTYYIVKSIRKHK